MSDYVIHRNARVKSVERIKNGTSARLAPQKIGVRGQRPIEIMISSVALISSFHYLSAGHRETKSTHCICSTHPQPTLVPNLTIFTFKRQNHMLKMWNRPASKQGRNNPIAMTPKPSIPFSRWRGSSSNSSTSGAGTSRGRSALETPTQISN